MTDPDAVEYHRCRALRELDLGLSSASVAAARAHLQLSSLHVERMRALGGEARRAAPAAD